MIAASSNDPGDVLRWVIAHQSSFVWLFAFGFGALAWASRRVRAWQSANPRSSPQRVVPRTAAPVAPVLTAAPGPAAYVSAPAYAPPPPGRRAVTRPSALPSHSDLVYAVGTAVELDERPRRALLDAFGDAASARTAVVLAEILAPPVGLR